MTDKKLTDYISDIIAKVKKDGDKALIYFTKKFDKVVLQSEKLKVSGIEIRKACEILEPAVKKAIEYSYKKVRSFHKAELRNFQRSWKISNKGLELGQISTSIENIGIYVPGGRFSYPSTVLMTAVPARIAGVKKIVMVTPPNNLTAAVLYAASLAGVDEIYRVGGPAAIAALAYGTKTIPSVDLIVGPGNKYVNEAKRQVFGIVGIDSLAGPSDVAILADNNANPEYVAVDMLAQMEHDTEARAYLFSDSVSLIKKVKDMLPKRYSGQYKIAKTSLYKAIADINRLAPEHLEIMVNNPDKIVSKIKNAGAIFVGDYSPASVGDYCAGPSHTLPTGIAARFSSGLSVVTFFKRTSFIRYTQKEFKTSSGHIKELAKYEGLKFHRDSIDVRK